MNAMRFGRLELENWRNFKEVDVPLAPRTFVVGPNAIGKSNLLDAFRFLRDLTLEGGGLGRAVNLRGGLKGLRSLHARQKSHVSVTVDIRTATDLSWRYTLAFDREDGRGGRPVVTREHVCRRKGNAPWKSILERPTKDDEADPELLTETALEQVTANQSFRELADFFRSVSYIHLVPQLLRETQAPLPNPLGNDPFGRDLLDRIRNTPAKFRKGRLNRIQKILKIVVPQLQELDFEADEHGKPHLTAKFDHWRGQGAHQRENQFSDGTLRLIGLLWTMQDKAGPLLLEEPELSLHSGIVSRLAPFLHNMQAKSGRQVLLSTHSTHLLADPGISPEEILLVRPAKEGSEVVSGYEFGEIRSLMDAGLNAAEAVLSKSEAPQAHQFGIAEP